MTTIAATQFQVDDLTVQIHPTVEDLASTAAQAAADILQSAIDENGKASVIFATANSQVAFLDALISGQGTRWNIDWSKVTMFHMDEYLGLPHTHPASFRHYMMKNVEPRLKPRAFHYLEGDALEPLDAMQTYAELLAEHAPDLCCLGIGENGHLAFNDPPVADFNDPHPIKIVKLDEPCRMQQVGEGHFPHLDAVPPYALTLTIPALCAAKHMLAIVPEKRKAQAVLDTLTGPISTACPGSYLRTQPHCILFLDEESASLLPTAM
ncbi:glucosamine-6-phosphate deaminase [Phragmitibacter flavus]|uniref:Glucosamine-6-phosphate deaminase n=1 Tax=Phragmitibacter flavus TaxID=2576071 RepID=A0A5R8K8C3_9BACT|nr:glucosamine-6-phosphate deaminase [Phragmitibacter flavus]TLD68563.1 glucosamine-6-phosphate deaminase [Phragmitibacter flavus]